MTVIGKICLSVMLLLLLLSILAYLPAVSGLHWFLRVGVPEIGASFLFLALPAALLLGRSLPKTAGGLFLALAILVLVPWFQALGVARHIVEKEPELLGPSLQRFPLSHSPGGSHTLTTETYKENLQWDRYTPTSQPITARVVFVHGGSWRNGTRKDYPQLLEYLADRGIEVFSVSYTLSGTAPYPAAVLDVESALQKLSQDELPLFIAGRSSGGHVALLAAYRNPQLVRGVIGFYPPTDMVWSYEHPSNPHVLDSQEAVVQFMTGTPEQRPDLYRQASPIDVVTPQGPPTLLIHGKADCLVYLRQSERLSEKLAQLGVAHYLLELPWTEHGGDITVFGPTGRLSTWAIEGFVGKLSKSGQ